MAETTEIAAQLAALRERYRLQLGDTLQALGQRVAGQGADIGMAVLKEIQSSLHKLAGSGGTFGFVKLSEKARQLEIMANEWTNAGTPPADGAWRVWKTDLLGLPQTLDTPPAQVLQTQATLGGGKRPDGTVRLVLIEDDLELGASLTQGLGQFGYDAVHFSSFAAAEADIVANPPNALLVDVMLPNQTPADGTVAAGELFKRLGYRLPTLVLTGRSDFAAKLGAARAHASAFLVKPVDIPTLAERVESVLASGKEAPFRVLIVDDDEVLAEHYRLTLAAAGMLAERVSSPAMVLDAMTKLNPDIILLDLYMPECSGAELARAVRYDAAWQGLPIVYLSAESDLDLQIEALASGADDFLTKPISDKQLVATVRVRAQRARKITALMSQDSLTGLLKHSSIKERLAQEVDRARRQGKPLAAVMIDIDHFKLVNDRWGHPMGDQVIKTLGQILRQRSRRQDSIGRYGGEEFAAVLPECTAQDAKRLMEDIRQGFANVRFAHSGGSFSVTLSAGVACSDDFEAGTSLLSAADQALYVAKHNGRNQVRIAVPPEAGEEVEAQRLLRGDGQ